MSWPSSNSERIPLAAAAAVVFFRVTGAPVVELRAAEMDRSLNVVARALSNVAQIYAGEPLESAKELSPIELIGGEFDGGAQIFRARDGREFYPLGIERQDILAAIKVLQAARIRFK